VITPPGGLLGIPLVVGGLTGPVGTGGAPLTVGAVGAMGIVTPAGMLFCAAELNWLKSC